MQECGSAYCCWQRAHVSSPRRGRQIILIFCKVFLLEIHGTIGTTTCWIRLFEATRSLIAPRETLCSLKSVFAMVTWREGCCCPYVLFPSGTHVDHLLSQTQNLSVFGVDPYLAHYDPLDFIAVSGDQGHFDKIFTHVMYKLGDWIDAGRYHHKRVKGNQSSKSGCGRRDLSNSSF